MKAIIYIRTSTKDQEPELQRNECLDFAHRMGLDVAEVVSEQGSAYKLERIRPKWESVQKQAKNEKLDIILWKYDRAFRNREEFYKFIKVMFEVYGTKVYSVTEPSIISFWEMMDKSHSENPIFNELLKGIFQAMWDFMIQQAGEVAEEESRKKSQRVKLAVRKEEGMTKSYKGNRWGFHSLPNKVNEEIVNLINQGKTIREITNEVFYWDKNRTKKYVSVGYVHKILTKIKQKESSDNPIS
jgi:DNA invertase Pin-like site-specific DNA recombinase